MISIISLLVAILLPALSSAREAARRVGCLAGQRQFYLALTMYANDFEGWLISGKRDGDNYEDVKHIRDDSYETLRGYGGLADAIACPNGIGLTLSRGSPWYDDGWGFHIGQAYLGRHKVPFDNSGSTCGDWPSPEKVSTADPTSVVIADHTTSFKSSTPGWQPYAFFTPHAGRGALLRTGSLTRLQPKDVGCQGQNVTTMDGSGFWKTPGRLTEFNASNTSDNYHNYY